MTLFFEIQNTDKDFFFRLQTVTADPGEYYSYNVQRKVSSLRHQKIESLSYPGYTLNVVTGGGSQILVLSPGYNPLIIQVRSFVYYIKCCLKPFSIIVFISYANLTITHAPDPICSICLKFINIYIISRSKSLEKITYTLSEKSRTK